MKTDTCDILIVGSGAAGLTAAAVSKGLSVIVVETSNTIGGTTVLSGGTVWIPENPLPGMKLDDSIAKGREYLDAALAALADGSRQPESSHSRRTALLETGPKMVQDLVNLGFQWSPEISSFPDYRPDLPGSLQRGRTLNPAVFDTTRLGEWKAKLSLGQKPYQVRYFEDLCILTRPRASIRDFFSMIWLVMVSMLARVSHKTPVSMGCSLIAQLLYIITVDEDVRIWTDTAFLKILTDDKGAVVGGVVEKQGVQTRVKAKYGVLLAAGGFSQNQQMRDQYLPGSSTSWSLANPYDDGAVLREAMQLGGATSLMHEVWGIPVMKDATTSTLTHAPFALSKPHSILVNESGNRFLCESQPYGDIVRAMYAQDGGPRPGWLITDQTFRQRYALGGLMPWNSMPKSTYHLKTSTGVQQIAKMLDIDNDQLQDTILQWNEACRRGEDGLFNRGGDRFQQYIGDPNVQPNPNMGPVESGPFYAAEIFPGDAGTKGGLVTDEYARVLRENGDVIEGLYASGNISASVMGATSLGAGVTLGPAMTFAHIAVSHMRNR